MEEKENTEKPSEELNHARFELWRWQHNRGDNFTQMLYDLMNKADPSNLLRLSYGFPLQYSAYQDWYNSEDPEALFEKWQQNYSSKSA